MDDTSIARHQKPGRVSARACGRSREGTRGICWYFLFIAIAVFLIAVPASAGSGSNISVQPAGNAPEHVNISIYVIDFNRVDVGAGTVGVDYYLNLKSDTPVSINDFELMNGAVTSITPVTDTPYEKEYRIVSVLTTEPDLSRYPFDRHTLSIKMESKQKNEQERLFVIDQETSGLYREADLPGWTFSGTRFAVTNASYLPGEVPYSRAVFSCGITRDVTSTVLKFFLPIMLIVIVSLSSLMMKISSRLGLNASMFLAAVLIHWRIADAIPAVAYATFLDLFMIITYATLVMALLSGILIMRFTETHNTSRVEQIDYWSIRVIPPVTITLYFLLFLTLVI